MRGIRRDAPLLFLALLLACVLAGHFVKFIRRPQPTLSQNMHATSASKFASRSSSWQTQQHAHGHGTRQWTLHPATLAPASAYRQFWVPQLCQQLCVVREVVGKVARRSDDPCVQQDAHKRKRRVFLPLWQSVPTGASVGAKARHRRHSASPFHQPWLQWRLGASPSQRTLRHPGLADGGRKRRCGA